MRRSIGATLVLTAAMVAMTTAVATRDDTRDVVVVPSETDPEAVLVVDGKSGDDCVNDAVFVGAGSVEVGAFSEGGGACPGEIAILSRGQAFFLGAAPWTQGADRMQPTLDSPIEVPVSIWVVSNRQRAKDWALNDVAHASRLFDENRAGLAFTVTAVHVVPRVGAGQETAMEDEQRAIGEGCAAAASLQMAGSPLLEPAQLNVYFVEHVVMGRDTVRGATCYLPSDGGLANVIYVSLLQHSPVTLAHEIGHAVMLRGATGHPDDSDDWFEQGFSDQNVMWSSWNASQGEEMRHFSLGQAYRMNVDRDSWLNEAGWRTQQHADAITRRCSTNPRHQTPCPRLGLEPTGSRE